MADVCSNIGTVGWVEPYGIPISVTFQFWWLGVEREVVIEAAFFFSASWYGGAAESKDRLSDDTFDNLLLMASGMLRSIAGGWLL